MFFRERTACLAWSLAALLLLAALMPATASAATQTFSDLLGHWAAGDIDKWNESGLIGGYSDGTFRPNQAITRAEFMVYANRGFGFVAQEPVAFPDVSSGSWLAGDVAKAVAAGYAEPYPDGSFRPNQALTRMEAAQMLYRILHLEPVADDRLSSYRDVDSLSDDERSVLNSIVAHGYLAGLPGQLLGPAATLTRAEMIVILNRGTGEIYHQTGSYGPAVGTDALAGNATVSRAGTTLRNLTINGDLYITAGVGDGEVYLENVTVKGRTLVAGGGPNCVYVRGDSRLGDVMIADRDGNVGLKLADSSSLARLMLHSGCSFDSSAGTGDNLPNVMVTPQAGGSNVSLQGRLGQVTVGAGISLQLRAGSSVQALTIEAAAEGVSGAVAGSVQRLVMAAPGGRLIISGSVEQMNSTATAVDSNITVSGSIDHWQVDASGTIAVSGAVTSLTDNAPGLSLSVGGTIDSLQAGGKFQLHILATGQVQALEASGEADGSIVTTDDGGSLGGFTSQTGCTIVHNGEIQTGAAPSSDGPGDGTGGAAGGGSGGSSPDKPTLSADGIWINLRDGDQVIGSIANGTQGSVSLAGLPDSAMIVSVTIDAPAGTTLQVTEVRLGGLPLGVDEWVSGSTIPVDSLLEVEDGDVSLGSLRHYSGGNVVIKGIASHPDYVDTPVTMTIRLGS